ncbi:MAG TPA: VanZ family protein [Arachnia sp.]|nr:VanZ family protein [Arachnia sp.]HMT84794.1 VanZ family protein [Arachnia sp.]
MGRTHLFLGILAISIGVVIGIALFTAVVTRNRRRRGELSFGRLVLWSSALAYFWAIWAYAFLPLPDPHTIECVEMITNPLSVVDDIRKAVASPHSTLTHWSMVQVVLNVALFAPLGFFLRVLGRRGVFTTAGVAFGLSLFIETTQLTALWGLYPCAYRYFDVGDLMTNTTGAILGSLAALLILRSIPERETPSASSGPSEERVAQPAGRSGA